jgi:hypothetical protein
VLGQAAGAALLLVGSPNMSFEAEESWGTRAEVWAQGPSSRRRGACRPRRLAIQRALQPQAVAPRQRRFPRVSSPSRGRFGKWGQPTPARRTEGWQRNRRTVARGGFHVVSQMSSGGHEQSLALRRAHAAGDVPPPRVWLRVSSGNGNLRTLMMPKGLYTVERNDPPRKLRASGILALCRCGIRSTAPYGNEHKWQFG